MDVVVTDAVNQVLYISARPRTAEYEDALYLLAGTGYLSVKNVIRLSGPKQQPDTHLKQPVRYLRRRCEPSSPQQTRNEQRYHRQGRSGGLPSLRYRCIAMLRLMCRILPAFRKAMPEEKLERNTSLVGLQAGATYQPGSATQSPA